MQHECWPVGRRAADACARIGRRLHGCTAIARRVVRLKGCSGGHRIQGAALRGVHPAGNRQPHSRLARCPGIVAAWHPHRSGCPLRVSLGSRDAMLPGRSDNLVEIYTGWYAATPLVLRGAGAGTGTTAAGVLSDMLELSFAM
eukprot:825659-Prymnesium_polylepis.3